MQVPLTIRPPRWTSDTPYCSAIGKRIGVMIVVMGTESMKQPRISSSTITQIRNRYLLSGDGQ